MGNFDYKHLIAVVVGVILGFIGTQFGVDFSKSCPQAPQSAVSVPGSK